MKAPAPAPRPTSLWRLALSPSVWALHFLLCYITAAIYCAKFSDGRDGLVVVRIVIAAYTAVAVGVIGADALNAARRLRACGEAPPFDQDTPEDRHRFMAFSTLLLAGLSLVATVFSGLVAVFFENCQ